MEKIEDETEYFGFVPVTFTADLQESLAATLAEVIQDSPSVPQKIRSIIYDSFRKNIFIFNNFVLRNILKFPSGFQLERKITDRHIDVDVSALVSSIVSQQARAKALLQQRHSLQVSLQEAQIRSEAYSSLLSNREEYKMMISGAEELKFVTKEISNIYCQFKLRCIQRSSSFDSLMQYKSVKKEYYKEERERAYGTASIDAIDGILSRIQLRL